MAQAGVDQSLERAVDEEFDTQVVTMDDKTMKKLKKVVEADLPPDVDRKPQKKNNSKKGRPQIVFILGVDGAGHEVLRALLTAGAAQTSRVLGPYQQQRKKYHWDV